MNEPTLTGTKTAALLDIAEVAAREAGEFLKGKLGKVHIEYQKSSRDDLLDVDLAAEKIILDKFRAETPDIGILSEEAGHEGDAEQYWIVDPLDGSANFQHGNPSFAIAIALMMKDESIGAVIYLPMWNEMYKAIQGQGAYLNSTQIHVSQISSLEDAIVHVGDIMKEGNAEITEERLKDVSKLFMRVRRIRMIGTAAADLAYLASGKADMLVNHTTTPWDVEAGKLLLFEAGGSVTTKKRNDNQGITIYSNGHIHQKAEKLLL